MWKTVRRVDTLHEYGCFTVALTENTDESGWHLWLMLADEFDEQDVAFRMDTHCLTNADQATVYGGLEGYELDRAALRLWLSVEAADDFQMPRRTELALEVSEADFAKLEAGLKHILSGRS
jgi:hypothetical protein